MASKNIRTDPYVNFVTTSKTLQATSSDLDDLYNCETDSDELAIDNEHIENISPNDEYKEKLHSRLKIETDQLQESELLQYGLKVEETIDIEKEKFVRIPTVDVVVSSEVNRRGKEKRSFKCSECNFVSAFSSNLKRHILSKHVEKKYFPFKCSQCEYASSCSSHLKRHVSSKHVERQRDTHHV